MCVTNRVDTVTPVVSEDEGHQQLQEQQQQCRQQNQQEHQPSPTGKHDLLQSYLTNLSCAETPPSNHKYKCLTKKSRSHEKIRIRHHLARHTNRLMILLTKRWKRVSFSKFLLRIAKFHIYHLLLLFDICRQETDWRTQTQTLQQRGKVVRL